MFGDGRDADGVPPKGRCAMATRKSGYGHSWKWWLAVYAAIGAVLYLIVYLAFFANSGGGGGGGLY
jgi:hypothetical protein